MYQRKIAQKILEALKDTPIVLLNGARQTGKSTLVQWLCRNQYSARYLTLDDVNVLSAARSDPAGFIAGLEGPVIIDEIQRDPELALTIKACVDRNRQPGRFLLTGSANVLLLPRLAETLAGRMEILSLWPLSQGEIESRPETFIDSMFSEEPLSFQCPLMQRNDLFKRMLAGGFPEAFQRDSQVRRKAWFQSYITTILQREVKDLSRIEGIASLPRLLSLLGSRAGNLMNFSELSRISGIPQSSLKRYIALFEATFLLTLLAPWSGSFTKRLVKSPKIFLIDSGLLGHLIGLDVDRLADEPQLAGPLLENFVVMELMKQISWSRAMPQMFHFRTHLGREVDIVLEDAAGRLVGIEVKAAAALRANDFEGLKALAGEFPKKFLRGLVLYTGQEIIPFGKNLSAVPVNALWNSSD